MRLFRRLAIALFRLFFARRPRRIRQRVYQPSFESNGYEYEPFQGFEAGCYSNDPAQISYYPTSLTTALNFYPLEDEEEEDDDDYDDQEAYLDENYGTVEYRLEVFGGDAFIEFSYEDDLDEQQVINALNLLWAASPNRQNHVASGTLRLPFSHNLPRYY
jgi:hypothetical protein